MSENYGVNARLVSSIAETPVSTETIICFIGDSATGADNAPHWCGSMAAYKTRFGATGTLMDAAKAVFDVVGINGAYFISATKASTAATSSELEAACAGMLQVHPNDGKIITIAVVCGGEDVATKSVVEAALSKLHHVSVGDGIYNGIVIYDGDFDGATAAAKKLTITNGYAICNLGNGILTMEDGEVTDHISGAAIKACLLAKADSEQAGNLPCRSIGNLACEKILGICKSDGTIITLTEQAATSLSADGITSWINIGGGKYYTWGDHTAAVVAGAPSDEVFRFDSNVRMANHLLNRFMIRHRNDIDKPMTIQMKNDVLNDENTYLDYCVSVGALVGEPKCEFTLSDNTIDSLQQGEFYFSDTFTVTPPAKYLDLKGAFTTVGYSVYLIEE